jgi:hypothetical protein
VESGNGVCHGDKVNRPIVTEHRTFGFVWRRERKKLAVHCVTPHTVLTGAVNNAGYIRHDSSPVRRPTEYDKSPRLRKWCDLLIYVSRYFTTFCACVRKPVVSRRCSSKRGIQNFRILLTVHLDVILVNDQFDAVFSMYVFHASTCFEQQVLIIRRIKLCQCIIWYNTL